MTMLRCVCVIGPFKMQELWFVFLDVFMASRIKIKLQKGKLISVGVNFEKVEYASIIWLCG